MNQPELGKRISDLRLTKGLTQTELALKCNLSLRTIQRIESADVTPRSYTIKLIFSCLDYDFYNSSENSYPLEYSSEKTKTWLGQFYKYVDELFNLKTNTMKKVTFISLVIGLFSIAIIFNNQKSNAQTIDGWFKAGSAPNSYTSGTDNSVFRTGKGSAFIESKDKSIVGFGTLMQTCSAQNYLGKRIKMTGYLKAENVVDWSGMWLRVDSKTENKSLSFDNMQDRAIKGTSDWKKCEIVLDVPKESGTMSYGFLISSTGKIWFDDITFEVVDDLTVKTTYESKKILEKPSNINFEE